MDKYEDDVHNCTNEQLAKMVREIARRHVEQDKETLLEAANRIEARRFEKQGEQKSIDKIEPKFKIKKGKWYVCIKDLLDNYANEAFQEGDIYLSTQDGNLIPSNSNVPYEITCPDTYFRDWTIQDAKDGDVLFTTCDNINEMVFIYHGIEFDAAHCYFLYSKTNNECKIFNSVCSVKADIHPVTTEQRDLLFQKMKEAGYEWDAEKKELKKIEQNPVWSEEDERICQCLIKDQEESLEEVKNNKVGHSEIISDLKDMYHERIDWLKSLKPNHWKPSVEQCEIIKSIIADYQEYDGWDNSIYTDIKRKVDLLRELIKF